jgi:hypothetical protein
MNVGRPRITSLTAEDAKNAEKGTTSDAERKAVRYEQDCAVLGVLCVLGVESGGRTNVPAAR